MVSSIQNIDDTTRKMEPTLIVDIIAVTGLLLVIAICMCSICGCRNN